MDLDFTGDQDTLRESIRAVLDRESPIALARGLTEGTETNDALWSVMTELGWPTLTIPEENGGIGFGPIELAILGEELGRNVTGTPLLATLAQFTELVRACADDAQRQRWLEAVANGSVVGTIGIAEETGSFDPRHTTSAGTYNSDRTIVTLHGTKRFVFEAVAATHIACTVRIEGDLAVVVIDADSARVGAVHAVDATRQLATIDLDGLAVPAAHVLRRTSVDAVQYALDDAMVALALETVGACASIFDVSLEYAKQRKQFGVPIGSFQAIKHKFADLAVALERARSTGYFAALCLAEHDDRMQLAAASAKAAAGDAQRLFGKEGIQIHGSIGFTWEHDLHLYVRRAKSNEQLFGTASTQRARIADLLEV